MKLIDRLAAMPLPTEDLTSTWCPPEWEDIVEWWDQFVREARELSRTGTATSDRDPEPSRPWWRGEGGYLRGLRFRLPEPSSGFSQNSSKFFRKNPRS